MRAWLQRLRYYLRRRQIDAALLEEVEHHIALETEAQIAAGVPPREARARARRRFGPPAAVVEDARREWQAGGLETLTRDLRFAVRRLARQPALTAALVVTAALGVGATTAVFTVLNAVLFRPLPYPGSDRLIMVWEHNLTRDRPRNIVSPGNYRDWRDRTRSADLAIFTWAAATFLDGTPERVAGRAVSSTLFDILGVRPALGRGFGPDDYEPGAPNAILLSHALWTRRFGGDTAVIGRAVRVREGSVVIAGVMPPDFRPLGPGPAFGVEEYWEPFVLPAGDQARAGRYAMTIGRLREGVTLQQARADLGAIAASLAREYPSFNAGWTVNVVSLKDDVVGAARPALLLLGGAIGLVLVIACANLANLMLARSLARRHELALRAAIGASRGRLLRESLVESLVVSGLGGCLGVLVAVLLTRFLVATDLDLVPRLEEIRVGWPALVVAFGLTLVVAFVAGLLPAVGFGDHDARRVMGTAGGRVSPRSGRVRSALVVAQVAFSLVLLAGAALLIRSLGRLTLLDPGFEATGVLTARVSLPDGAYDGPGARRRLYEDVADRVAALPGVEAVGMVSDLPLTPIAIATRFRATDRPVPEPGDWPTADIRMADTGYFAALRIPVLAGRVFDAGDRQGGRPVIVVNQSLARLVWPGSSPLGRELMVNLHAPDESVEIVGVVGDVRQAALAVDPRPMIYYPLAQVSNWAVDLVIRRDGPPLELARAVQAAIREADPELAVPEPVTLESRLADDLAPRRYTMLLMQLLAAIAVALAAVGLYGVLAFLARQRAREMAVRRALGASDRNIMGLMLIRAAALVGSGLAIGLVAAIPGARLLRGLLYEISPWDPIALGAGVAVLAVVGLAAALVPVRRVASVDPVVILRSDD